MIIKNGIELMRMSSILSDTSRDIQELKDAEIKEYIQRRTG